jgi:hypothetical protein
MRSLVVVWAIALPFAGLVACNSIIGSTEHGLAPDADSGDATSGADVTSAGNDARPDAPDASVRDARQDDADGGTRSSDADGSLLADRTGADAKDSAPEAAAADAADAEAGCGAGYVTCDGGACAKVASDLHNCGACGHDCALLPNVSGSALTCNNGVCGYQCSASYGDCADAGTGCATLLQTSSNCGRCGAGCTGTMTLCAQSTPGAYACTLSCPSGETNCSGTCANVMTDPQNCGSCGFGCIPPALGTATCDGGVCGKACGTLSLCGNACVDEKADDANCGGCGVSCTGGETCQAGVCGCPGGSHDCSGVCSSNTSTASCGATSCTACAAPAGGDATCNGTACGMSCSDTSAPHLCGSGATATCVNTVIDSANCGACGTACAGGKTCQSSVCACPASASTTCGTLCVNLQSDGANCGACGHDCQGGLCLGGVCQPRALGAASGAQEIALDSKNVAANVYWTDRQTPSVVGKVVVATGASSNIGSALGLAWNLAVTSTRVFWGNDNGSAGSIMTVPIAGGTPTSVVSADSPYFVVADATNVYWTSFVNATESQAPIAGAGAAVPLGSTSVWSLALDSTSVYWAAPLETTPAIMKAPIGGGGPAVVVTQTAPSPLYLTVDATNVYFITQANAFSSGGVLSGGTSGIWKAPITGGAAVPLVTGLNNPLGISVDSTSVYWCDSGTETISKIAIAGGTAVTVASGVGFITDLAVDTKTIYFAAGGVWALAK